MAAVAPTLMHAAVATSARRNRTAAFIFSSRLFKPWAVEVDATRTQRRGGGASVAMLTKMIAQLWK